MQNPEPKLRVFYFCISDQLLALWCIEIERRHFRHLDFDLDLGRVNVRGFIDPIGDGGRPENDDGDQDDHGPDPGYCAPIYIRGFDGFRGDAP